MDAPGTLDPRAGGLLRLCRPYRSEFPVVVADVRPRPDIRQPAPRTRRVPGPRHAGRPGRLGSSTGDGGHRHLFRQWRFAMLTEDYTLLGVSPDSTTPELIAAGRRTTKSMPPGAHGRCVVREERS